MSGTFGAFVQIALLTAQHRDKVLTMRWSDLDDNLWRISTEPREKTHAGQLLLPPLAMEIIRSQPVVAGSPYVFTGRGIGSCASTSIARFRTCGTTCRCPRGSATGGCDATKFTYAA
jgi:integrase